MGPAHQTLVTRVGGLKNRTRLLNSQAVVRASMCSQLSSDARCVSDFPADPFCSAADPHGATSLQRQQGRCRRRAVLVCRRGSRGCCGSAERVSQRQGGSTSTSILFCVIFGCGCSTPVPLSVAASLSRCLFASCHLYAPSPAPACRTAPPARIGPGPSLSGSPEATVSCSQSRCVPAV